MNEIKNEHSKNMDVSQNGNYIPPNKLESQVTFRTINNNRTPFDQFEQVKKAIENEDKDEILWGLRMKEFISTDWSVVGVSYVLKRGVFWLRRVIWLTLVLFGFGFMVYQIRDRGMYYLSNPTQVDVLLRYKTYLNFPTVTVCSENLLDGNRSSYQHILPDGLSTLMKHIYPPRPVHLFEPDFTVIQELSNTLQQHNITWEDFWSSLSPFEHKRHIVHCIFNGKLCGKDKFTLVTTDMGYCLQFNGEGFHRRSKRSGPAAGLRLMVNVQQTDFLYTKSIGSGLRILLHNKGDVPHVSTYGFRASTGFITSAAFRFEMVKRLPKPYANNDCTSDTTYSYNRCVDTCRHEKVIKKCGCRFFYYQGSNITTCNPQEMYQCADAQLAEYPNTHHTAKVCGCMVQCETDKYLYSLSQSVMSDYAVSEMAHQEQEQECHNNTNCNFDKSEFEKVIRRDWAEIELYFSELFYEEIARNPAYTLIQLLCDIGGALGLILGATVLSFFEIVDFLLVLCYDAVTFRIGKSREKKYKEQLKEDK